GEVTGRHIGEGEVVGHHIGAGEVTGRHIGEGEVAGHHIGAGEVTSRHIGKGEVTGQHIAAGSIRTEHLEEGILNSIVLQPGTVTPESCSFVPVRTAMPRAGALQQFGMSAFLLQGETDRVDVRIAFDEPFPNNQYVLVAMTNHPECHAVLKSQATHSAVLEIHRRDPQSQPFGCVSWIAIG
ncbi:WIAG-tail domain, partial [Paenibacillus thiaminolyticus]|uniref:WIAG-tail domain n=1 Tax=Paenibacillus thiaminolyticus TaxID=49283 RepID=UPI001C724769